MDCFEVLPLAMTKDREPRNDEKEKGGVMTHFLFLFFKEGF